ncbi:MAG: DUF2867 domain-containing protein [Flavobacteriaceae bacterium]
MNYRVPNAEHLKNNFIVQELAKDFELLDVWEYPLCFKTKEGDSLYKFRKISVEPTLQNVFNFSPTGILFSLRAVIGKIFRLDNNVNDLPIPNCKEISFAERLTKTQKEKHFDELNIDLRTDNFFDFQTVYSMENETVNEISNATEHTLMHYGWIKESNECFKVQMASYVKHRSRYGKLYIWLIKPFKYWVVYPYLFNKYVKKWKEYKKTAYGNI